MGQKHEKLLQETFLLIQKNFPNARIFPRHVGLFYRYNGSPIKINFKGMADAYLLLPYKNNLLHVEIEFKKHYDKQSKEQIKWQKMIESIGGLYILVKEPNNAITEIKKKWPDIKPDH